MFDFEFTDTKTIAAMVVSVGGMMILAAITRKMVESGRAYSGGAILGSLLFAVALLIIGIYGLVGFVTLGYGWQ